MSRYRNIYCKIWNDDKFPFLSDDAKLIFFHLLTTPLSNQFGCFKAGMASLAEEIRWSPERYRERFRELFRNGFAEYDERFLVVFIPNFILYNEPANPNVIKSWSGTFNELPESELKAKFYCKLEEYVQARKPAFIEAFSFFEKPKIAANGNGSGNGSGNGFAKGSCNGSGNGMPNQEQEQEQEQEQDSITSYDVVEHVRPAGNGSKRSRDIQTVFEHWQSTLNHPNAKLDEKRKRVIGKALKNGYSVEQLKQAIDGCAVTPHNIGDNDRGQRYDGLNVILRDADQIDRFINNYHNPPEARDETNRRGGGRRENTNQRAGRLLERAEQRIRDKERTIEGERADSDKKPCAIDFQEF